MNRQTYKLVLALQETPERVSLCLTTTAPRGVELAPLNELTHLLTYLLTYEERVYIKNYNKRFSCRREIRQQFVRRNLLKLT